MAAEWGNWETLQKLWKCVRKNLTTEEINNKLLLPPDKKGRKTWQFAAELGVRETLQKLGSVLKGTKNQRR